MTLKQWHSKNDVIVARHGHARSVSTDSPNLSDLFRLDDYIVSGRCGGVLWLVRRYPFTAKERNIRSNIWNYCVGLTYNQVESLLLDSDGDFPIDCINEYLLELEYENK